MRLELPVTREAVAALRAGQLLEISGPIFAARDAAHRRLAAAIAAGAPLPIDLHGAAIYYVGPTPARPGRVIGAAGPTTAARLDPFTPALLAAGLRLMIGKGGRSEAVRQSIAKHGAAYLMTTGGAGALLQRHIKSVQTVAYEDLGTEAIRLLDLEGFPAIVACDAVGGDLFASGRAAWRNSAALGGYPLA